MQRYRPAHSSCWEISCLYRDEAPSARAARASGRLLDVAGGLETHAHLTLVMAGDGTGAVQVRLHTDTRTTDLQRDLPWVSETVADWTQIPSGAAHLIDPPDMQTLVEVVPAVQEPTIPVLDLPSLASVTEPPALKPDLWPVPTTNDGMEILEALTGVAAQVRVHIAPASELERQWVADATSRSVQSLDPVRYSQYMGTPVRIRCFVGQQGAFLSPRLRAAVLRMGVGLRIVDRDLADEGIRAAWEGDILSLSGSVQPAGVALCFVRLPASGDLARVCGVPTAEADTPPVPLSINPAKEGVRLGSAWSSTGALLDVHCALQDLLLHTQILGATGTGKSSLLAGLVREVTSMGFGVSVIEPHGTLVERIVDELPAGMVDRTVVVRSADDRNPVPLNVLRSEDSETVSEVMLQVLRELHDPRDQGFLGPRFERGYGLLLGALRELLGESANLASLPLVMRSREHLEQIAAAISPGRPELAEMLRVEFARLRPEDFGEIAAWINSKFQRLVSTAQMRAILSTGEDAVDVTEIIDDQHLLLVDLASPTVGPLGAQLLGEMWLVKHWQALSRRSTPDQPHLLIVDEAHLFASGLLPRLLAEARKFGVGVVIAHQHLEQLSPVLRDAALATTSNVVVFRSGPREAESALSRLGAWPGGLLTRLPRLQAAATLSTGHEQTDAFTLMVDHNDRVAAAPQSPQVGDAIDQASQRRFVEPFRSATPITAATIDARLKAFEQRRADSRSDFLDSWLARQRPAAGQSPSDRQ